MSRNVVLTGLTAAVLVAVLATVIAAITTEPPPPEPEPGAVADASAGDPSFELPSDALELPEIEPSEEGRDNGRTSERAEDTGEEPAADSPPVDSTLTAVRLDGQDIADMLGLAMWRFEFEMVPDRYTVHLWVERWTPGADAPRVRHLVTESSSRWGRGEIVVKLPTEESGHLFARIDDVMTRAPDAAPMTPPRPWRVAVADDTRIRYGQAMHLVTFTHSESERPSGGLRDVHRDHDVTVYVKARFIPGPFEPFNERSSAEPELGLEPELPAELSPEPELDVDAELDTDEPDEVE